MQLWLNSGFRIRIPIMGKKAIVHFKECQKVMSCTRSSSSCSMQQQQHTHTAATAATAATAVTTTTTATAAAAKITTTTFLVLSLPTSFYLAFTVVLCTVRFDPGLLGSNKYSPKHQILQI